jgi:PadR family transcriptional regulator PadR
MGSRKQSTGRRGGIVLKYEHELGTPPLAYPLRLRSLYFFGSRRVLLHSRSYLPILMCMPRRKPGSILPIEQHILESVNELTQDGADAYGFSIARRMADAAGGKALTSHGTLYKALARLNESGVLEARWEAAEVGAVAGRPRRRLYLITAEGVAVLEQVRKQRRILKAPLFTTAKPVLA